MNDYIKLKVNNNELTVKLAQNTATTALMEYLQRENITISAHDYGEFEKVGALGFSLPTDDHQITAQPGDIMLYQGNQITIFYGSNAWSYTKIGEIIGEAKDNLKDVLGTSDTELVLSLE